MWELTQGQTKGHWGTKFSLRVCVSIWTNLNDQSVNDQEIKCTSFYFSFFGKTK